MTVEVRPAPSDPADVGDRGIRVETHGLTKSVKGGIEVLHDVSLAIEPGELVAIVGGSGAGKTTLLEAMAGVAPADGGRVTFDGVDLYGNVAAFRTVLGYVPQDDIIHTELSLRSTLRYAARLRFATWDGNGSIDAAIDDAMRNLDLAERADTRVGSLSGGQRKRASIAVEMLTRPRVFFLDEPTSGLDPATGTGLLRVLRRLADREATVVFTTHAVQDLAHCDRVVFLARGGRVAFIGSVDEACRHFGVAAVEEIYEKLADVPAEATTPIRTTAAGSNGSPSAAQADPDAARAAPGMFRQWQVLTARAFETMARNTLTLAILLGSPLVIVAMFTVLFRPGAFDLADPDPTSILMILFWVTFGAFFFGITYGLLQIVTERPILRREHLVGLRLSSYLASKVTVLLPLLVTVNVLMVVILRLMDRLPAADTATYASLIVTLTLDAVAALTLGLLASAMVSTPAQATLALPMLCFPAVLFSGAILPVHVMARVGVWISAAIPTRWAFEAVGRDLGIRQLLLEGGSPLGPPLVAAYGAAGQRTVGTYWLFVALFGVAFFVCAWAVLARTVNRSSR